MTPRQSKLIEVARDLFLRGLFYCPRSIGEHATARSLVRAGELAVVDGVRHEETGTEGRGYRIVGAKYPSDAPTEERIARNIVRTCRPIWDVEPPTLPAVPKGTYGIFETSLEDQDSEAPLIDFGPPWGVQRCENADLLDAAAVLGNAMRSITYRGRPWKNVVRRTLRSFAGPYLVVAVGKMGFDDHGTTQSSGFSVEAYFHKHRGKRAAVKLLKAAQDLISTSTKERA